MAARNVRAAGQVSSGRLGLYIDQMGADKILSLSCSELYRI